MLAMFAHFCHPHARRMAANCSSGIVCSNRNRNQIASSSASPVARYAKFTHISDDVFMKSFFLAKISYEYTMNYLH
jgi:hypothetical protein